MRTLELSRITRAMAFIYLKYLIEHNGLQPYAVVCLPVRWENCVKGAVTCVRGVVGEPVVNFY